MLGATQTSTVGGAGSEGAYHQGCGAGVSTLEPEADGGVKGCPSLPTTRYTGGNVRQKTIRAIWDQSVELGVAREERQSELGGFCFGCYYADVCKAGCSWTAHVFFGKRGNNPYCHHRATVFAERGQRERRVCVAPPPGEPFDHGL